MESKHNCIDCAKAVFSELSGSKCIDGLFSIVTVKEVKCNMSIPQWIKQPCIFIDDGRCYIDGGEDIENCPAWYPNTLPQWTLPEWKKEGEYAVSSGVTHNGKRWECFKENGGKFGEAVEPGTDPNVWREAK